MIGSSWAGLRAIILRSRQMDILDQKYCCMSVRKFKAMRRRAVMLRTGREPAVMGIFRRATLNMVCTVQQNLSADVSIGLLRDRIGRHPWILAAALP